MLKKLLIFCAFSVVSGGAFSAASLPIVNVSAGSVSARAAFGEKIAPVVSAPVVASVPVKKSRIISRTAKPGPVVAALDILTPNRPASSIWANELRATDAPAEFARAGKEAVSPLRLPTADEFVALKSDFKLPEESLSAPVDTPSLDNEIAKLVELQRRADESVSERQAVKIASVKPRAVVNPIPEGTARVSAAPTAVRKLIVPADDKVPEFAAAPSIKKAVADDENDFAKLSPSELKKAFQKTYVSENKHLSTYQIDDRFDVASDVDYASAAVGFDSSRDLSETGGVRPLEIKISFLDDDSALSRDNYNLLSEYASIVIANPKRAIQVSIPERATKSLDGRKLAARRLAIVEQVLKDTGVNGRRIIPVLSQRGDDSFVLRVISNDQYDTMVEKRRDMFGDTVSSKKRKSMSW